jgi:uncharacterized membrane protein YgcG
LLLINIGSISEITMLKTILFLVCLITLAFPGVFPAMGLAQSVDLLPVIDDAKIFGNRSEEVEAAVSKLTSQGADVRVRTISSYGTTGNLDRYEEQLEQQSPSWLGQNGVRKNNLIVLIISLQERQTGLYYGDYWESTLVNNWLRIQTDIMNPLFRNGDYAGGTIKGLEEIQRLIRPSGTSPASSPAPAGQSNWWIAPVVIVVLVGLVAGLFWFSIMRKNRTRRLAARQKAVLAKQAAHPD